jgi:hypothetical protein
VIRATQVLERNAALERQLAAVAAELNNLRSDSGKAAAKAGSLPVQQVDAPAVSPGPPEGSNQGAAIMCGTDAVDQISTRGPTAAELGTPAGIQRIQPGQTQPSHQTLSLKSGASCLQPVAAKPAPSRQKIQQSAVVVAVRQGSAACRPEKLVRGDRGCFHHTSPALSSKGVTYASLKKINSMVLLFD